MYYRRRSSKRIYCIDEIKHSVFLLLASELGLDSGRTSASGHNNALLRTDLFSAKCSLLFISLRTQSFVYYVSCRHTY